MKVKKNPVQQILNHKIILPDRNNINKQCRLTKCEHADINSNDVGRIVDVVEDGYAIEFHKLFKVSSVHSESQTNVIFGAAKDTIILS